MAYHFEKNGNIKEPTLEDLLEADAHYATIVLDKGTLKDGSPYWAYVAVKPSKYKEYKLMTSQHRPIKLKEYGEVLKCGLAKEVPTEIYNEMRRQYNLDEAYLANLGARISKERIEFLKKQENQRIGDIVAMLKMKKPA